MLTPGVLIIVFLLISAVHLQAFENKENTEGVVETPEFDQDVPEGDILRRIINLQIFNEPKIPQGKVGGFYDDMPYMYRIVFEVTIYLEAALFCVVLVYGLLHLPLWEKLYNKYIHSTEECETTDTSQKQSAQEGEEEIKEMKYSENETSNKSGEDS